MFKPLIKKIILKVVTVKGINFKMVEINSESQIFVNFIIILILVDKNVLPIPIIKSLNKKPMKILPKVKIINGKVKIKTDS